MNKEVDGWLQATEAAQAAGDSATAESCREFARQALRAWDKAGADALRKAQYEAGLLRTEAVAA